jgi:prevent-host-death family protein
MKTVAVSELRENFMSFIKKVKTGENFIVTSRGHEVAKLVPVENKKQRAKERLKELQKTAYVGDVLSSVDEEWEALK